MLPYLLALVFTFGSSLPRLRGETGPHEASATITLNFRGDNPLSGWTPLQPGMSFVAGSDDGVVLAMERRVDQGPGSFMIRRSMPLDQLRGRRIRCEARVRAEGVAVPPNVWNGVKVMLHIASPSGDQWEQKNSLWGTFDWRLIRFRTAIPTDATEVSLLLGLEATTGKAWFDEITITAVAPPNPNPVTGPVYRGHDLPRLRGAMIGSTVDANDLKALGGEWKANHVRWQLIWGGFPQSPGDKAGPAEYDAWLDGELKRLDRLLPVCREVGIKVLIDLHTPPGGRDASSVCRIFQDRRFQDHFVSVWERIARRYRGNTAVWGYDLVNEPVECEAPDGLLEWQDLALKTALAIRAIDTGHAIIVEPAPWGGPEAIANLDPLPVKGVVYSVHMYQPHKFTHQGIYGNPTGIEYPGIVDGKLWDKDRLRQALKPALDFQRAHHVHMYIGEFSAIRWAPGNSGRNYLRDLTDIFEEYGWDWAYHAYREWDGWSVEHGSDPTDHVRSTTETDRARVLRAWYARNLPARK